MARSGAPLSFQGVTVTLSSFDNVRLSVLDGSLTLNLSDFTGHIVLHKDEVESQSSDLPFAQKTKRDSPEKWLELTAEGSASHGKRVKLMQDPQPSPVAEISIVEEPRSTPEVSPAACFKVSPVTCKVKPPQPRWGHRATIVGRPKIAGDTEGYFVLITGGDSVSKNGDGYTLDDMHFFDLETNTWLKDKGQATVSRSFHTATFLESQNMCVVFGGENNSVDGVSKVLGDLMILDMECQVWFPAHVTGKAPSPRTGHSAVLYGEFCIFFGGTKGSRHFNDLHVLDTTRWNWFQPTITGTIPPARAYHGCALVGSKMVVIGGDNSKRTFGDVHVLDLDTWQWEKPTTLGAPFPARTGHGCLASTHSVVVTGGWNNDGGADTRYSDVFTLDTVSWTWELASVSGALPSRAGCSAVALLEDVGNYKSGSIILTAGQGADDSLHNDVVLLAPEQLPVAGSVAAV